MRSENDGGNDVALSDGAAACVIAANTLEMAEDGLYELRNTSGDVTFITTNNYAESHELQNLNRKVGLVTTGSQTELCGLKSIECNLRRPMNTIHERI